MSRQTPDLEKIAPPTATPPDDPDRQTEEEDKEIKRRKALTPAERADQSHSTLIGTLNAHVDFHRNDCEKWESHAKMTPPTKVPFCENAPQKYWTFAIGFQKNGLLSVASKMLQEKLMIEKDNEIKLVSENSRLKEITHSLSLFSWLAYLTTVLGAILVGVAGSVSNLSEVAKSGITWAGVALTFVGLICATYAHLKSKRANT